MAKRGSKNDHRASNKAKHRKRKIRLGKRPKMQNPMKIKGRK